MDLAQPRERGRPYVQKDRVRGVTQAADEFLAITVTFRVGPRTGGKF